MLQLDENRELTSHSQSQSRSRCSRTHVRGDTRIRSEDCELQHGAIAASAGNQSPQRCRKIAGGRTPAASWRPKWSTGGGEASAGAYTEDFGPSDVFEAVSQWEQRMIKSDQAIKKCATGAVLSLDLQDLVVTEREASVNLILEHCGLENSVEMRDWFNSRVTAESAHAGRWRRDFDDSTCAVIDEVYDDSCERLHQLGISIPVSGE